MRFFVLLTTIYCALMAQNNNYLNVKDSNVLIKINGEKRLLQKDATLSLDGGDSICFLEGDGRIVINDSKQLTYENKSCYIVPVNKNLDIKKFITSMKEKAYIAYFDSTETVKHGSSAKGTILNDSSEIVLKNNQDLLINSNSFGPLPVDIFLYDENNVLLEQFTNDSESVTLLRIPNISLKNGYKLKVLNGFNQLLLLCTLKII